MQGRRTVWFTAGVMAIAVTLCLPKASAVDLRLPAIDPSGQRIFLPPPASTSLNLDKDKTGIQRKLEKDKDWLRNWWPKPAYQNPPSIPLCGSPQAGLAVPVPREEAPEIKTKSWLPHDKLLSKVLPPPDSWLDEGQLQVAPLRTVARVGSEVIIVGGVCTSPGILIRGEVVEWYLLPRSVGQFSDGGSQYFGPVHNLLYGRATYAEPDYVLSLGAPGPRVLTRGTKAETDDILLEPGQAWVSLFSNEPGTSYVVAYAPRLPHCDEQKIQAVVHWVEGEWDFPRPSIGRAGTLQTLTTTVRRFQTGEPLGGWTIRYDILSGPGTFEGTEDKTSTLVTGADGLATVRVKGLPDQGGTTRIGITVTQPGVQGSEPLVVGRGETTIEWTAVDLDLKLDGPPTAYLDQDVTYTVTIRNLGAAPSPPLTLIDDLPPELVWINSDRPQTQGGQRHTWQIDPIPPQGLQQVLIQARTNRVGTIQHCVSLLNVEGGPRESCISTAVNAPPLEIQVTGERTSSVGKQTTFHIELTNRSNLELSNIALRAEFERGLEHFDPGLRGPAPNSQNGVLQRELPGLRPGETHSADITFTTLAPGSQCVRVSATSDSASVVGQDCVQVDSAAAAPSIELQLLARDGQSGPLQIGEIREYTIRVTNNGNVPLNDVKLDAEGNGKLEISHATPAFEPTNVGVVWQLGRIEPGQTITHAVAVRAEAVTADTCLQVTVLSRENATDQKRDCPPIVGPGNNNQDRSVPSTPTPETNTNASGGPDSLYLEVRSDRNNAVVGGTANLFITLISRAGYEIQDVEVRIQLPPGLDFINASGGGLGFQKSQDGRTVTFDGIRSIRPNDQLGLQIQVRPLIPGELEAQVQVGGPQLQIPLIQRQTITVTN